MKVLMLSTDENILISGSESQQRMIDYGSLVEELHIIVSATRNYQLPITNYQTNSKFQISNNVWVYPTRTPWKPLYFFDTFRIAKRIIENCKLKIENCVVTTQDPFEIGLVGYFIKIRFGLPLQIQVHTDFLSPYFWKESVRNKLRVILGKWLIKKAGGVRVVSERIKNSLSSKLQAPSSKISVLPIFADAEKIKNSPVEIDLHQKYPDHDFIILMASRLTREKNIGLAIAAMEEIVKVYPKALLLVVGSGPELEKLKAKSYKLKANIVFEPWSDDLTSYYKTADLFLLTSNYEGYGRTVVEATAASLPVLMTDVGVAIGSVVPVGDKEMLVDRLELFIGNRSEMEEVLESQKRILEFYHSKEDYLNQIKQSWRNCFS